MRCRICDSPNLIRFVSFGKMPVANAFLKREQIGREEFMYDMEVGFCEKCNMVQLINIVPYDKYIVPDETGKTNYAFFSSTSKAMSEHFALLAKEIEKRFLEQNSKVIEIGSNDGIMLKSFSQRKNVLGIEPSQNVAEIAQQQGIETITKFFSQNLARQLVFERGKFRVVTSTNVFLNIIDVHDFLNGVNEILDEKGVFITEDPYIPDILEKVSYDQIYDEHIWYFSLISLSNLLSMHNMEIFDAEHQEVHGGSMRVYMCKRGRYNKTERFLKLFEEEMKKGINSLIPYLRFSKEVEQSRKELTELLSGLKSKGKKIAGYAAASKGTIVLNYCNIGKETLEYISDSTPFKQGLYSPGKHIPVVSPDYFHNDKQVDYVLLGAWNHAKEIMEKEADFLNRGGRFIVHYPKARILESEATTPKDSGSDLFPEFPGVKIKQLKIWANDQGYLFETIRADDAIFGGEFGQILISELYPNIIKGLHKHERQTDYTTCIKGNIKYVLAKEKSNGEKEIKTIVIGEKNPIVIKTPPGYWHGYMPLAGEKATVLHMMDKLYNPKDDDTLRKDPFEFGDIWTPKNN